MKTNKIIQGDCLEKLKELEENSVDSIVTDPPYELGFMGKSWDNTGVANNPLMWAECLRVLKPGGYLLSFGGTRTYHRMAVAIEDAGFEVRDMIEWIYGSGFPKSLNIGKVTDKFLKTGNASWNGTGDSSNGALGYSKLQHKQDYRPEDYSNRHQNKDEITEDKAKQWEGWGTALKPAHEPICMARKPLAEKTVAENVLKYGTGGINIDESRVGGEINPKDYGRGGGFVFRGDSEDAPKPNTLGRFPANLLHDNSEEVRECFPESNSTKGNGKSKPNTFVASGSNWNDENTYADSGNASRFFKSILYQAKASKSERNKGMDDLEAKPMYKADGSAQSLEIFGSTDGGREDRKNNHPTVKPIALMEYLIKMVTKPGGVVLDPFCGSGSTLVAAKQNGYQYIGIEMTPEYIPIIEARLKGVKKENTLF